MTIEIEYNNEKIARVWMPVIPRIGETVKVGEETSVVTDVVYNVENSDCEGVTLKVK